MTENWRFSRFLNLFKKEIENRVHKNGMDMVVLVLGTEGSGKSYLILLLAFLCDKFFQLLENFCFTAQEYISKQKAVNVKSVRKIIRQEKFSNVKDLLSPEEQDVLDNAMKCELTTKLRRGSVLAYDEAGTQMNAAESQTRKNISQKKVYIANRHLGLVHLVAVPKPQSLDKYVREDRCRWALFCYTKKGAHGKKVRKVAAYDRYTLTKIFMASKWQNYFQDPETLLNEFEPACTFTVPNIFDYIPEELVRHYELRKSLFTFKLLDESDKKLNFEEARELETPDGIPLKEASQQYNVPESTLKSAIYNFRLGALKFKEVWFIHREYLAHYITLRKEREKKAAQRKKEEEQKAAEKQKEEEKND